jgi:hypothetical protein
VLEWEWETLQQLTRKFVRRTNPRLFLEKKIVCCKGDIVTRNYWGVEVLFGGVRDIGSSPKVGCICTVTSAEYGVLYFPLAWACCILEGVLSGGLF